MRVIGVLLCGLGLGGFTACTDDETRPTAPARCPTERTVVEFQHAFVAPKDAGSYPTCPDDFWTDLDGGPVRFGPDGGVQLPPCIICRDQGDLLSKCVAAFICDPGTTGDI
jgi:hypothetical protein